MYGIFKLQQWLWKCTKLLCSIYFAYLVLLLALCVLNDSYMNMSWEKSVIFKDAINGKIILHKRRVWIIDQMKQTRVQAMCLEKHLFYCHIIVHKSHIGQFEIGTGPMKCNANN